MSATDPTTCSKCGLTTTKIAMGRHAKVCRADEGLKVCSRCGEAKPFEEFHHAEWTFDGYEPRCKACKREMAATPQARGSSRQHKRDRYATDPEYAERQRERARSTGRAVMDEIRTLLGGQCAWDGCEATESLDIDHVNEDGVEDRQGYNHGSAYYRRIRDELRIGQPTRPLQLLCRRHHGEKRRLA